MPFDFLSQPYFLAGLQGYSDLALRLFFRRSGCPFAVTESIQAAALLRGGKVWREIFPDHPEAQQDRPLAHQLIGADPATMAQAAAELCIRGATTIDINLACPSKVSKKKRSCGGNLLADPDLAIRILRAVVESVAGGATLSIKLRRSFDESESHVASFYRILEAGLEFGYRWATVHARTVEAKYRGPAHWPFLADLVTRYPEATIFGSGDVWTAADALGMVRETGVAAVSVARGAIGNPWIFSQIERLRRGEAAGAPTIADLRTALSEYAALADRYLNPKLAGRMVRKFSIKWASWHPDPEKFHRAVTQAKNREEWNRVVEAMLDRSARALS